MTKLREQNFAKYQSLPDEISPLYSKYSDVNRLNPDQVELSLASDSSVPSEFLGDRINELDKDVGLIRVGSNIIKLNTSNTKSSRGSVVIEDLA